MAKNFYDDDFYSEQENLSLKSANEVLNIFFNVYKPKSVIDIGCGLGTWLSVCANKGIEDILGIDGDYVDKKRLYISPKKFISKDITNKIKLDRKFDLLISLEVAEHLQFERAKSFVDDLVNLSDVIMFSAALPYQGGTNHINENWPQFWSNLFHDHGYQLVDFFRPNIWDNQNIAFWYRQNTFLFVRKTNPILKKLIKVSSNKLMPLSVIHPELYLYSIHRRLSINLATYNLDINYLRSITSHDYKNIISHKQSYRAYSAYYKRNFYRDFLKLFTKILNKISSIKL
jgi:hypothetical protein